MVSTLTEQFDAQGPVQDIVILGSTGSIGQSTLEVLALHPDRYRVYALTANSSVELLLEQCKKFQPKIAVIRDENQAEKLAQSLTHAGLSTQVESGGVALERVAAHEDVDIVMAAIVGAAGLLPTLAAVKAGKRVLLANKEALVMSGHLFMSLVRKHGAQLLPIDSEHNAIFQCLPMAQSSDEANAALSQCLQPEANAFSRKGVRRILLTASGGPFLKTPLAHLPAVTPKQACAHPNWEMGQKISVDSATMMNKGLEVIEACWLFDADPAQVEVVIHPQSVIHSMVDYEDGSVLAQLGNPDMRTPIAYGLAWPARMASGVSPLNLLTSGSLDFDKPDTVRFPCLALAYQAMQAGGTATCTLNAANEEAVAAFLNNKICFTDIPRVIEEVLVSASIEAADSLDVILQHDELARQRAQQIISSLAANSRSTGGC